MAQSITDQHQDNSAYFAHVTATLENTPAYFRLLNDALEAAGYDIGEAFEFYERKAAGLLTVKPDEQKGWLVTQGEIVLTLAAYLEEMRADDAAL